ncbi:cytochrome P450 [Streptacidiphilus sp. P02-A3a]|uniref:cytochrome P450 family protein n=1 Tax=Streptacidiphilus sp. P02-A3a TaxID=2704468 RepID=UPI0015F9A73F|nr:cytochrome P450 [Streptacidiphilus sp. P02-A3a]QMU71464.1 cytochrome P450 [Streptacidiphilus sp. P02-A3a]
MSTQPDTHPAAHPERRCPVLDVAPVDPYAEIAELRALGPAVRVELPGAVLAWSVTRADVIRRLTGDPRISRDPFQHWPGLADLPEGWPLAAITLQRNFFNTYGEEHWRGRRRVVPSFAPRRVERLRAQVQATADRLVDELAALPPGQPVDLRKALSQPLTLTVICDLIGVPESERAPFSSGIDALLDTTLPSERVIAAQLEVTRLLGELTDHKAEHPGQDLATDLLAQVGQDGFTVEGLRQLLFLMIGAGFETSVNLITSAVHNLLDRPQYLELLELGRISWDDVVEETLRHSGPVMHAPMRYAIEDVDLGEGVLIRKGEPILIAFGAAGRDPAAHPDASDTFDPLRPGKEHLSFGYGPHFCLGAPLARLESSVALSTLFARFPGLRLADPGTSPERVSSFIVNGLARLPVLLD